MIVSPFIEQGTVLRPNGSTPYDHTSIIATLRKCFGLGAPLSRRDAVAPDLELALSSEPSNMGPERIEALPLARAQLAQPEEELSDLQSSLLELSKKTTHRGNGYVESTFADWRQHTQIRCG